MELFLPNDRVSRICLGAIILTIMTIRGFQGAFSEHDHFGLAAGSCTGTS